MPMPTINTFRPLLNQLDQEEFESLVKDVPGTAFPKDRDSLRSHLSTFHDDSAIDSLFQAHDTLVNDCYFAYTTDKPRVKSYLFHREGHLTTVAVQAYGGIHISHDPVNGQSSINFDAFNSKFKRQFKNHWLNQNPEEQIAIDKARFHQNLNDQRQQFASNPPDLCGELHNDLNTLMEWASCYQHLHDTIYLPGMMDCSNRHLTRIQRALVALESESQSDANKTPITLYRAVPIDATEAIGAGDWTTPQKHYAERHAAMLQAQGEETMVAIVEAKVGEAFMCADANEYCYVPAGTWHVESLLDLWLSNPLVSHKPRNYPDGEALWHKHCQEQKNNLEP
ncbi:hypothetical protein AB6D11_06450 [Vibrio splendidus]